MKYTHISGGTRGKMAEFKKAIATSGNNKPIFVLFYLEGCGPCNAARPEWNKLARIGDNSGEVYEIDQELLPDLKDSVVPDLANISGFPSIKYITNRGATIEDYTGGRSVDDFSRWIASKHGAGHKGGRSRTRSRVRRHRKRTRSQSRKHKSRRR